MKAILGGVATVLALTVSALADDTPQLVMGHALVSLYCADCHAIERMGASPHPQAPAFRDLHWRYDVEELTEALVEGLVSGHPDMPEFEFDPEQADAIVAYLKSLEH